VNRSRFPPRLEQSSILGLQILDDILLLAADPSDQQEEKELNRERHRAGR
jgi:hypothetical protein